VLIFMTCIYNSTGVRSALFIGLIKKTMLINIIIIIFKIIDSIKCGI
jgi:hypothetical protein